MSVRIYIKDNGSGGKVREYGTDRHDSLILQEDGSLHYYNLQNGEGTGDGGDYEFCMKDGSAPTDEEEGILDIGGELTTVDCQWCKWRHRHQKCTCCKRNPHPKDCYEKDEQAVAEFQKQLFEFFDAVKEGMDEDESEGEFL
ncbi:MAG: hypothetical protein LUD19_03610 [Clostridia bacterium]|nr:hypothetical protein [Clostridia bacterium]